MYLKAFHIIFMVSWFAGLLYLPRLFIYHLKTKDQDARQQFTTMEKRLFAISSIGMLLTFIFGLSLAISRPYVWSMGWFHLKMILVLGLSLVHFNNWRYISRIRNGLPMPSERFLKLYNEVPALVLIAAVLLVVIKWNF